MSCPIRRLAAAALITIGWLPLSGDTQVASADHGVAEPPTTTRQSTAVGVGQNPAGEFIPGCDDEAKMVIERALVAYHSLQTYQDTLVAAKGRQNKEGFQKTGPSMKIACSFAKPNRIALTGPLGSLFCDGRKYWERLGPAKQYTEQDAPQRIDFDELDLGMLTFRASHPIVWLLTQKEDRPVRELFGCVKEITGITAAEFDGRPGKRISGLLRMKYLPVEDPTTSFDAWFSDETGLVEEFRLDLTEAVQEMEGRGSDNARFLFRLRFQNIKLDERMTADRFVFQPMPGDTRTEEFEFPAGRKRHEMIGRPAPALSGKDMAGSEFHLSDCEGRVVVLDFWATWCRGCVPALLKLQNIAEKYAGQSVSVIGINKDEAGSERRVAGFLENRNVKFRQVVDVDSKISQAYGASALPHTVLIDRSGMIRAIHVGLIPEKKLSLQIDRMLQEKLEPAVSDLSAPQNLDSVAADLLVEPKIDRRPTPATFLRGQLEALPKYEPGNRDPFKVDLRSCDLSKLDLKDSMEDLLRADFDDRTVWPAAERMPGFSPKRILELGKNPGLGVRNLHARGITGHGVGLAIIDLPMLVNHQEYADRLRLYEETNVPYTEQSEMHGPAVSSIAVGKTVGVAPQADLYFIATYGGDLDPKRKGREGFSFNFDHIAVAIDRILEINATLPQARRIRVLSISLGWAPHQKGYKEVQLAAKRATDAGMLVVCSSIERVHGFTFHGLGRDPEADSDDFAAYRPGAWWAGQFDPDQPRNRLLAPMDCRTTASPTGPDEYVFYREGGWSWTIPYIAATYALAAQVEPTITPVRFWALAMKTGRTIELDRDDKKVPFGPILDTEKLIEAIEAGDLADEAVIEAELAKYNLAIPDIEAELAKHSLAIPDDGFRDSAFRKDINEKVAKLDVVNRRIGREQVIEVFGEPLQYRGERKRFEESDLPDTYVMVYPDRTRVLMADGVVHQLQFHTPGYTFTGAIQVGSTLDQVLQALPQPTRTLRGQKVEWEDKLEDDVLYEDINGNSGVAYYARPDKALRLFFRNNQVTALYLIRPR